MKTMARFICVLALVALVIGNGQASGLVLSGDAAPTQPSAPALIITASGTVGEGDDFATMVLGNPWDMNEQSDILLWSDFPNADFSGGIFSYNVPPTFWAGIPLLLSAGTIDNSNGSSNINVGKLGINYPINTSHYHWLSFRVKQPAGSSFTVIWNYSKPVTTDAYTYSIPVTASDWQTYVIDLRTYPKGAGSWTGQPWGLYLRSNASAGSQVSIDWARLTADNPANNSLNISWSGLSPVGGTADFYLDTASSGCSGTLIHTESSAQASGSFVWGNSSNDKAAPVNFAPGTYYVCAKINGGSGVYSAGSVTINQAPMFHFTKPSYTSGPDYATDAGNPWDMNDASDVSSVTDGAPSFQNGLLAVHATPSQTDQQVYLSLPNSLPIDSSRYHYLTYKVLYDYPTQFYVISGQFSRIYWGLPMEQSKVIYLFPGWQTYSFDLRSLLIDYGPAWLTGNWTVFRLDPITNAGHDVKFYIDDVKLTGDEIADTYADIQWQMTDPDTSVTTATLYYDTDQSGLNGTLFATSTLTNGERLAQVISPVVNTNVSIQGTGELTQTVFLPMVARNYHPPCTGACYTWDTSAMQAGRYYLYACLDDGYNHQACRYSETPLIISHP